MTNNLNTIEGAQQEVIDQLEYNLQAKGVLDAQFNPTTGLLGLINRIPDIEPSTNINLNITLTLTSAEPSVDYGGSILLSATLMASYEGASDVDLKTGEITGATITFKKGGTIIGTSITNNNGVATLLYTPVAADCDTTLNLSAVFSGTDNFNSANSNNINVDVNSTLELTSDKDILSYADNEYATLTATLNSADKNNKEVIFEVREQSDDSLVETLTGNTDSSGNAIVYYYGKGAGDIYIKTKCMNLQETYGLEDNWKYIPTLDNTYESRWTYKESVTTSYSNGYLKIQSSSQQFIGLNESISGDISIEFDTKKHSSSYGDNVIGVIVSSSTQQTASDRIWIATSQGYGTCVCNLDHSENNTSGSAKPYTDTNNHHVKITVIGNVISYYVDNTLIRSETLSVPSNKYIEHYTNNNRHQYIKDFKIKRL